MKLRYTSQNHQLLTSSELCTAILNVTYMLPAGYVGYTRRQLYERVEKHKKSAIGKHQEQKHNLKANTPDLKHFLILNKCRNKLDCLFYEIFY